MSDLIYIHGLKVDAQIGIYEWEQRIRQTLIFDLDLTVTKPFNFDGNLQVDYGQVAARITDFVSKGSFVLLETLAEEITTLILREFKVKNVRLKISKLAIIPNAREVGVIIERP